MTTKTRVLFAALSFVTMACGPVSSTQCGPGTVESGGFCIPADAGLDAANGHDGGPGTNDAFSRVDAPPLDAFTIDSAVPDASAASDAFAPDGFFPLRDAPRADSSLDGSVVLGDEFVSISIETLDGLSVGGRPVQPVAAGLPTTFLVYGQHLDGSSEILTSGITFSLSPAGADVDLTAHDGFATVTPHSAFTFGLVASTRTASGFDLTVTRRIEAVAPTGVTAEVVGFQDGPWFIDSPLWRRAVSGVFANLHSSRAPVLPATAPVGGGVRIVSAITYTLTIIGFGGMPTPFSARSFLEPGDTTYSFDSGTMAEPGLIVGTAATTAHVGVEYMAAEGGVVHGDTTVRFLTPSPTQGLLQDDGFAPVHWSADPLRVLTSRPEGTVSLASFSDGSIDPRTIATVAPVALGVLPTRRLSLVALHGTGSDEYFEYLPGATVRLETLAGSEAFSVTASGDFIAGTPGVGVWLAHASGFVLPGLALTPYPMSARAAFRVTPNPIALTLISRVGTPTCATAHAFVTPGAGMPERELTALESLAIARFTEMGSLSLDTRPTSALEVCAFYFGPAGAPTRTSVLAFRYLGLQARVTVEGTPEP